MAKKSPSKKTIKVVEEPKNFTRPYGSERAEATPSGDAVPTTQVPEVNAAGYNVAE
jgi:hypothetical protein